MFGSLLRLLTISLQLVVGLAGLLVFVASLLVLTATPAASAAAPSAPAAEVAGPPVRCPSMCFNSSAVLDFSQVDDLRPRA